MRGERMGQGQNQQARATGGARPSTSKRVAAGIAVDQSGKPFSTADLEAMDRDGLLGLWQDCFGRPAPKGMSLTFLRRFLAFDLQARSQGGLSAPPPCQARPHRGGPRSHRHPRAQIRRALLREWNGVTHVIDATQEGYHWQGQHHRSLSAIARAITGAQWSGPRFFGLKPVESGKVGIGKPSAQRRKGRCSMSSAPVKTIIRCAIYTRKSSDEGLDQEFSSLDAQYEACSAYIASQKHEGWKRLPDRFDDGGISGGTLERPRPPAPDGRD